MAVDFNLLSFTIIGIGLSLVWGAIFLRSRTLKKLGIDRALASKELKSLSGISSWKSRRIVNKIAPGSVILWVDDLFPDHNNRHRKILGLCGVHTITARKNSEAREFVSSGNVVDLVISDIGRSETEQYEGLQLPGVLKTDESNEVPFIFFVGRSEHERTPDGKYPVVTTTSGLFREIANAFSKAR